MRNASDKDFLNEVLVRLELTNNYIINEFIGDNEKIIKFISELEKTNPCLTKELFCHFAENLIDQIKLDENAKLKISIPYDVVCVINELNDILNKYHGD